MKKSIKEYIDTINKREFFVEEFLSRKMLEKSRRDLWISGQNLLK